MGTIARVLGIAVVLAGAALGTASPSSADQAMEGIYTFNTPGQPPAEWTIYPICVPTVGDLREPLELPVACTLKVVSATHGKATSSLNNLNWGGDARLTGGQWALTTNKADGLPVSGRQHRTHRRHLQVRRRDAHRDPHVPAQRGLRRTGGHDQDAVHAHVRQAAADPRRASTRWCASRQASASAGDDRLYGEPAVHVPVGAGDVSGVGTGQITDHACDVAGVAVAGRSP